MKYEAAAGFAVEFEFTDDVLDEFWAAVVATLDWKDCDCVMVALAVNVVVHYTCSHMSEINL